MPHFHALVDAVPGEEPAVGEALRGTPRVVGVAACREPSHDWLIRFEAPSFDRVDEFLQTTIHRIRGVKGVEIVVDWEDFGPAVHEARARLDA